MSGGGLPILGSQLQVDGQLYPDLGFGQVTNHFSEMSMNYVSLARIERLGSGAKVSIVVGGSVLGPERTANFYEGLARGTKTGC